MGDYQYEDLPRINLADDSPLNSWSNDYVGHMHYPRHAMTRTVSVFGENITLDEARSQSRSNMQPLQRFLNGPDRSPLAPGLLHAKFNQGMHPHSQNLMPYEQPWPSTECGDYTRDVSPETSSSGSSSHATQNELRSPHMLHRAPYGSPSDFSQSRMPYPNAEQLNGRAYTSEVPMAGGSISLRDIEYNHDESEPAIEEHDHIDTKPEFGYEQEPLYSRMEVDGDNYQSCPDSGIDCSIREPEEVQPMSPGDDSDVSEYTPSSSKVNKKRRTSQSSLSSGRQNQKRGSHGRKASITSLPSNSNRVTKKTREPKASQSNVNSTNASNANNANAQRPFLCPLAIYGCQSNFVSKNEWKRHVKTQHIKLGYWRCDLCLTTVDPRDPSTTYYNDFNRMDLFTQHLRRMHAAPAHQTTSSRNNNKEYPVNEDNLAQHQKRCYQILRSPPPESACLFCDRNFAGPGSWDERMEHVGRHFEKDRKAGGAPIDMRDWQEDKVLRDWLLTEGLVTPDRDGNLRLGDGKPRRDSAPNDEDESDADN
ncbi:hypothetical protein K469DRAFT_123483 [Zopfia rhizophila CBS 207.26]|uniref:C2H2-type domain-containing protein n=1 Tax=Zopfia rhizophila CBS 207.26 TaxID=1314779 RepID=A0A6A6EAD1_9PEZI|nr:hypothetical protein K469DRAFT_123483 [Zopfia rhizophila CBS 207.26]